MSSDHASGDMIPVPTAVKDPGLPSVGFSSMWDSQVDGLHVLETEIDDWGRAERRGHQERHTWWTWWTWAVAAERWTPRDLREQLFLVRSVLRTWYRPGGPRGPQRPMLA
jgi:hypothetical protein